MAGKEVGKLDTKRRAPALIVFVTTALVLSCSTGEHLNDALNRFESVAIKSSRSSFGGKGDSMLMVALVTRLRSAIEAQHWQEAIQLIHEIQYKNQAPEVMQLSGPLLDQLRNQRLATEEAKVREMQSAIKRVGEALLAAQDPKELDQLIAELTRLSQVVRTEDTVNESEQLRRARSEVNAAQRSVRIWQEYLVNRLAGNQTEAAAKMQSLTGPDSQPVVPRSEVLARSSIANTQAISSFRPETAIKEVLARAKSLENIDAVRNELEDWERKQPAYRQFHDAAERVSALQRAYRAYLDGRYDEAFDFFVKRFSPTTFDDRDLSILQHEFLFKLLPLYLGSTEIGRPVADEMPSEYLLRLVREAVQKRNWSLALRETETCRKIAFGASTTPSWLSDDITAFAALARAERQEGAGQFSDAVGSYRAVLECNGQNIPVELIGQRLTTLREKHPEAFAFAQQQGKPGGGRREE